ncbi:MAG: heparinase II/III-family protein, partial [Oscillospiraceae bacterium]|nr:heparinase II/III-family protein [Oscillospiraceae bacterium]
ERRSDLMALTLAECIFAKGRYIDPILNLIWAICEESSWVPSAHNNKGELPDIEYETFVDLFSAETGSAISFVYYFLKDIIEERSPTVKRRMEIEVDRRILAPYLKYNHFWYMGLEGTRPVNNWNPWINSNVLVAFAVFEKDKKRLFCGIEKTAKSADAFIRSYHDDGACDEGPGYFGAAGAALFDYLETLSDITGGEINIYENELIKNMARYIYRVYIGNGYFVNYADGPCRPGAPAKLLARVGEAIGDGNLTAFANELMEGPAKANEYPVNWHIYRGIKSLFQGKYASENFAPPKTHWFGGTEILTARDKEGVKSGMFISAKGGHNAESHNHNDVGHFILYSDQKPVIIDAGVETYTKKTFGSERYDIWTMQSCYHNLPSINGQNQVAGPNSRATEVKYAHCDNLTTLSMQLKDAYPKSAEIKSYAREFIFRHGSSLTVCDKYSLKRCAAPFTFNLLCADKPAMNECGALLGENMEMTFDASVLSAEVDEIELSDPRLRNDWRRDYLYRIRLTEKEMKSENEVTVVFKAKNA